MENELKPVNCGCGGEASVITCAFGNAKMVLCGRCGMRTVQTTEAKAIEAWNRAMRRAKVDILQNTSEDKGEMPYCPHCGDELEWHE